MFNLIEMRKQSGLSDREFEQLENETRAEFPHDEMLYELHLVRALDALRNGWISKEQLFDKQQSIPNAAS